MARVPLSTVRVSGGGLSSAAAAVLPVVPAVQLRLSLQLLLSHGECPAQQGRRVGSRMEAWWQWELVGWFPGARGGLEDSSDSF